MLINYCDTSTIFLSQTLEVVPETSYYAYELIIKEPGLDRFTFITLGTYRTRPEFEYHGLVYTYESDYTLGYLRDLLTQEEGKLKWPWETYLRRQGFKAPRLNGTWLNLEGTDALLSLLQVFYSDEILDTALIYRHKEYIFHACKKFYLSTEAQLIAQETPC
jgi:hypothetical protein